MRSTQYKRKVVFSVTNSISYDQRVMKIAETVSNLGCEITVVGRKSGNCDDSDKIPFRTKRFRMLFKRGFLFYKFFNIRLFFYLLFHKYDILVSNDLDTLLPNFLISKLKHLPLVYDSHEYFTGLPEIQNRPFVAWVWKSIEKMIFPRLKYVMTVSDPIAALYQKMYQIRPLVVRNFSKNANNIIQYTRNEINVAPDDLLAIIQGTGINIDRGAEELIDAVKISDDVTLLVVGSGDVVPDLMQQVKKLNIGHKVKFIPPVPWETLMKYTRSADIGLCLDKDINLNYRYSLPNKLFDYIAAGIPVIASDLPETGKVISENGFGVIIDNVTPENISFALSQIKDNPGKLAELKRKAVVTSEKLNWETESEKVIELYKNVLKVKDDR
ncbi:MAG TPA: glycosyltransferase [Anaerovoracaceae bacterium]|nr:glycosyltransferase [Anaerovoracaceae bacterium]